MMLRAAWAYIPIKSEGSVGELVGIWIGIILLTLLFLRSGQRWKLVVSMTLVLLLLLGRTLLWK